MSQRKGRKIPMIPSTMYPFRNVSKHTVKSKKMYRMIKKEVKNQSSTDM